MKKIVFLFILYLLVTNEADSYLNIHSKKLLSAYHERQLSTPVLSNTLLIRYKQDYFNSKNKTNSSNNKYYKILTSVLPFNAKITNRKHNFSPDKVAEIERYEEPLLRTFVVEFNSQEHPLDFAEKIKKIDPRIEIAEPYYVYQTLSIPNDPRVNEQYLFAKIKAIDAYNISTGSPDVVIAISDNGISQNHPDLIDNIAINASEVPDDGIDNDGNGYIDDYIGCNLAWMDDGTQPGSTYHIDSHGTEVAGIASATTNNGIGIAGVGYNCKFFPIKCSPNNSFDGIIYGYQSIIYAAIRGFKVINCSWGGVKPFSVIEQSIIDYAIANDLAIVAAAGNIRSGISQYEDFYPGAYRGVLSVGEVDQNDNVTYFTTSLSAGVRLMAPGKGNLTTSGNSYVFVSNGTSYSSPVVAGALGVVRARFPELSARQATEWLRINGDDITDINFSNSKLIPNRINLYNALARNPRSYCALTVEDFYFMNSNNEIVDRFSANDTLRLVLKLKNHLGPADSVYFNLSLGYALQENIEFINSNVFIPKIYENEELTIDSFKFIINSNFKQLFILRLDIRTQDEKYRDFAKIPFYFGKEVTTLSNNVLRFSVGDLGTFGYDNDRKNGVGFESFSLGNHLFRGGLMAIGNSAYAFSSIYGQDFSGNDFTSVKKFINPSNVGIIEAKRTTSTVFNEVLGMQITSEFLFPNQNQPVVKNKLTLKNVGNIAISQPAIGYIFDWDIDQKASKNYVEYFPDAIPPKYIDKSNISAEIAYSVDKKTYVGAVAFSDNPSTTAQSAGLNMDDVYNQGGLSQSRQVQLLSSGNSIQTSLLTDIGFVVGMNFNNTLLPGEHTYCYVCIATDSSRESLATLLKTCVDSTYNSIAEFDSLSDFDLFPNPASHFFKISNPKSLVFNLKIYNYIGNLVFEKSNVSNNSFFDISKFQNGIYFVHISFENNIYVKQLIISK
ncbi:MAG: S8/S53 family peptidase [Bacteroidota bacterium]